MRWIPSVFLILLLTAAPAHAETKYVSDRLDITVRSGPGIEYRIMRNLPTGTRVETLEKKDGWTRIKLSAEKNGWVLNRYLSDAMPDSKKYAALKARCEPLEKQVAELESANQTLKSENQALSEELSAVRQELSRTKNNFKQLKEDAADYLALKEENKKLTQELKAKTQKIETLETRISDAFLSEALKWFLSGAGVLIIGILIGARNKRKRSSLM